MDIRFMMLFVLFLMGLAYLQASERPRMQEPAVKKLESSFLRLI